MDFARAHVEVDAVDGVQAAIDLAALDDLQQRRAAAPLRFASRSSLFAFAAAPGQFDQAIAALRNGEHAGADDAHAP